MIGTTLSGRYEIVGELGRGGMGVVYLGRDPRLNREVAIKILPQALMTASSEERFQREAELVARMDHPAIVPIYDIGQHEGSFFFVMPVVRGANLRQFLREKGRSLGEILELVIQVADALEYSHARQIIHRDIKPENIMVTQEDGILRARVMDFGLAKASSEHRLTKTGTLVGTVLYISPEQVVGKEIDGRSDLYALGTVLYEALAGEPPFTGETEGILYRVVHENPRSIRSIGGDIPEELEHIVLRMLAKEKTRRYQTGGEIADALRKLTSKLQESERSRSVILSSVMTAQIARPPQQAQFVGREMEFAELQRRLNMATDGECQFVAIGGEAGIGKSRLLAELENLAKARRIQVLHGRFIEQDRTFSYQGFCEVIQEYFRARESSGSSAEHTDFSDLASDLVDLFPVLSEIGSLRAAASSDALAFETKKADDKTYLYELLARTLGRIAGGKPLLLIFENLHGAEKSLDALQYVVRRLGPTPTLIAGTYRQTEIDKRHPLVKMLDGFSDDPRACNIFLGPFTVSEHKMFVEAIVGGGGLSDDLTQRLFEATEANPFFTKELVRSLLESGGISRDDSGLWTLSGEMAISTDALPATIQQAVEKRIERLPDDARDVLSVASVLGKSFEFRDLENLADSDLEVDEVVEKLIHEGLMEEERESRGDRLTFSSGIVRDVLYSALSRRKRKMLHRRYAEQLEKRFEGRLERIYPQLVHHFSEGDVPEKTISYGMKAARKSLDAFSPEEAMEVIRTVIDFLEDEAFGDPGTEGDARMLLVTAYRMTGNVDLAMREAEAASRAYQRAKSGGAALALLAAAEAAWEGRRVEEARKWLTQGIAMARQAKETEALENLLSLAATIANLRGEYDNAREYLEEAERLHGTPEAAIEEDLPRGGRLVVGLANPVRATEPAETAIIEETEIIAAVFEPLATSDEHGHVVPLLCEKWEVLHEGRSLRIVLRADVRFHDGTLLTAAAVKESFEHGISRRTREMSAAYAMIRGAAELKAGEANEASGLIVRGDLELEIQILEPLPIYPAFLTDPATGIVRIDDQGRKLGTGPFRIAHQAADRTVIEPAAGYWRGTDPILDAIEFRTLPTAAAMATQLRSGEIDVGRDLLLKDMEDTLRDPRFRTGLVETPKKTTYFMAFHLNSELGGNQLLRRALSGVVRLHDLVWRTLGRIAQPATGIIPPGILGHDAGRRRTPLSRDQASELILESGVSLPIRLRAAVHPLFLDRYRALTDALFDVWAELGVEVSVETKTMEDFLSRFGNSEGLDLIMTRWNADFDDPDNFAAGLFHSGTGVYSAYFSSPEADEICEQARAESRPDLREAMYRKFEHFATIESAGLLPLFHEIDYRIVGPRVRRLQLRSSPPYVNYPEIAKVAGEGESSASIRSGGGVLYVPVAEDIDTLEPNRTTTVEQGEMVTTIFDTMTRCLEGAQVVPWLASEIRAEDGGRRFHFRLRDGVRFHDGRRLTSRDVRYTWERCLSSAENNMRWLFGPIRGAQAIIDGTTRDLEGFHITSTREFTIELEAPLSFFPTLLVHPSTAIVQEGTEVVDATSRDRCVGTGPFRLVKFEPGQRLEVEKNPYYWRPGFPKAERIIFRFGVSPEEVRSEFLAGRFSVVSGLYPADVEDFRHQPELVAGYREVPRLSVYFAAFNRGRAPFDDPSVRRRVAQAADVAGIVRRVFGRMAIPAHGIIPPGLLGYVPALHTTRSLSGEPVTTEPIELTAAVNPIFFGQYAEFGRELWNAMAAKGIVVKVVNRTLAEFLQRQAAADVDLTIGRWVADYPDSDTFAYGMMHRKGGIIGSFSGTRELDSLAERGRREIDPGIREAIYREVDEIIERDSMLIPLFHEQVYRFARPEVEGLSLSFGVPEIAYENLGLKTI